MPSKKFKLNDSDSDNLVVSWKRSFKDTKVFCKGELVCSISDPQELEDGRHVELPDGSHLDVSLRRGELILLRDGAPVPGSSTSAQLMLKHAVYSFYVMALITFGLGGYVIFSMDTADRVNESLFFGLSGLALLACGYLTGHGKRLAVFLGLVLTALYIWFWVFFIANVFNNIAALVFLIVHVFLVMKIIKAFPAIRRLNTYLIQV